MFLALTHINMELEQIGSGELILMLRNQNRIEM